MTFLISLFVFGFGLVVGSFLNALIHRLHSGQSILEKHSRCPKCDHPLVAADLVPLYSFFALRGRCRYCGKKISWQYPLVELVTALAFLLVFVFFNGGGYASGEQFSIFPPLGDLPQGDIFQFSFLLVFVSFLIVIFVYDLKHYLILDCVVFPAAGLALIYQLINANVWNAIFGAIFLSGFFALIYFFSHGRWIGFGDVKLGLFLGLLIPFPVTLIMFLLAYFIGALLAIPLLIFGKRHLGDRVPFGTFLTLAAFIAILWGEQIASWYFRLIGFGV